MFDWKIIVNTECQSSVGRASIIVLCQEAKNKAFTATFKLYWSESLMLERF